MKRNSILKLMVLLPILSITVSCGDSSGISGGGTEFKTVYLTSSARSSIIDADVAAHSASGADLCTSADVITIPAADTVDIDVTSNIYPGTSTSTPRSSVQIKTASLTYSPVPSSTIIPSIPTQFEPLSVSIPAGGTVTIPVRVGYQEIKQSLLSALICNSPIYSYYVTIRFRAVEDNTQEEREFTTNITVKFADFADS